ncbi:MAG: excinuclease ABC subunit UvrC [Coriobacteriales bacterium]|nr:excinuclease ABC subunit UvrC [Coriobacteriales bacterium]
MTHRGDRNGYEAIRYAMQEAEEALDERLDAQERAEQSPAAPDSAPSGADDAPAASSDADELLAAGVQAPARTTVHGTVDQPVLTAAPPRSLTEPGPDGGPSILERLDSVPLDPGCYLWKGAAGEVLYVGKAKHLRDRMRQYVLGQDERAKIPLLMEQTHDFEYVVCQNETEALVLEKNLIQQYSPPYNVDFRDDKSYPFIALTEGDEFPAIKYTREKHKATTRYFGPYTDSRAARKLVDMVRKVVPICSASCAEWRRLNRRLSGGETYLQVGEVERGKACFDYHVGLGPGPCCGACSPEEYRENVRKAERFLAGRRGGFVRELEDEMQQAAADLDFERAARYRDRIAAIKSLEERQHAVSTTLDDIDVVGFAREETITGVHVFVVREGRVLIGNEFVLDKGLDVPMDDLVETFLTRYYDQSSSIPREVVLEQLPEDPAPLEEWLTGLLASKHGAKVHLTAPHRGEKAELLKLAQRNASHTLTRYKVRTRYDDERTNRALLQLESALALPDPPMRIECFDVSTIHGRYSVASMVVFTNGRPDKSQYRRFKIRMDSPEANDFAMMSEVLGRRYSPERMADERFGSRPDLLIVDGGKPQLTAAINQLQSLGLDIPVAGLAKADEELFVPWQEEGPVVLPTGSPSLYLVKQVRDESHRFAITFHRELRGKGMTVSILDGIDNLGPKRKKALMRRFGSIKRMREASLEELMEVPGINEQIATDVKAAIAAWDRERSERAAGE